MEENEKPENPYVYAMCDEASFMQQGITLRDHFAGLAIQALLSNPVIFNEANTDTKQFYAYKAYQFADAMLEQRQK